MRPKVRHVAVMTKNREKMVEFQYSITPVSSRSPGFQSRATPGVLAAR